jgi:dihydromonapterin reductase / dihydrofolate reductase
MKALVTGVNSLVNRVLADKLVAMGYEVIGHYHTENELTAELKQVNQLELLEADFANPDSIQTFMEALKKTAPFDVIVNGAVCYVEADDWKPQFEYEQWQKTFSVNTTVPGLIMANADKLVADHGVVVNISSVMGNPNFGDMQFTIYGASKAALDLLTSTYAKRFAPRIRVAGIAPAYVHSAWNKDMNKDELKEVVKDHLTRRLIEPAEIADLMEAIINNPSITATTIPIDGGYSSPIISPKED